MTFCNGNVFMFLEVGGHISDCRFCHLEVCVCQLTASVFCPGSSAVVNILRCDLSSGQMIDPKVRGNDNNNRSSLYRPSLFRKLISWRNNPSTKFHSFDISVGYTMCNVTYIFFPKDIFSILHTKTYLFRLRGTLVFIPACIPPPSCKP